MQLFAFILYNIYVLVKKEVQNMANSTIRKSVKYFIKKLHPRIVEYKKNEIIPNSNLDIIEFGYILEGMVYLCAENQDYERNILCIFQEDECCSSALLFPSNAAASYLITKQPTKIAFFQADELTSWLLKQPLETYQFIFALKERLEENLLIKNYILHQKTLRNKLICYFKKLSVRQNSRNIKLPIPYSDLADYLAVDRSALMKEISKMKKEQLISGKNHSLTLEDSLFQEHGHEL